MIVKCLKAFLLLVFLFSMSSMNVSCYANDLRVHGSEANELDRILLKSPPTSKEGLNAALLNFSSFGSVPVIKELIKRGADINARNQFGTTPLGIAVSSNNYDVVKFFLRLGQDPNAGYLSIASASGYLDLVKLLLSFGAKPDYPSCGGTALMSATAYPEIVRTLIKDGANINATDNYGRTVMMWAVLHGRPEVVDLLCRLGVDLKRKDKAGNTAFSDARRKGRSNIIRILEHCSSERAARKK